MQPKTELRRTHASKLGGAEAAYPALRGGSSDNAHRGESLSSPLDVGAERAKPHDQRGGGHREEEHEGQWNGMVAATIHKQLTCTSFTHPSPPQSNRGTFTWGLSRPDGPVRVRSFTCAKPHLPVICVRQSHARPTGPASMLSDP